MIEPFKASNVRNYHVRFKDGYNMSYCNVNRVEYPRGAGSLDDAVVMLYTSEGTHTFNTRDVQSIDTEEVTV